MSQRGAKPLSDSSALSEPNVSPAHDRLTLVETENALLREELHEARAHARAMSDVLGVISRSPTDLQPVLDAIVEAALPLCDAIDAAACLREGTDLRINAHAGSLPVDFDRLPLSRGWVSGRCVLDSETLHVENLLLARDEYPTGAELARRLGHRTCLAVPLLRDGEAIGCLFLRRGRVEPFSEAQLQLMQTFADQAVIAIHNAQLFQDVQSRTKELARSLQELRAAQDRLVETQKLAALGQLTAGVAHEIKNPLNFINNFAELSAELIDEQKEVLGSGRAAALAEATDLADTIKGNLTKVVEHGRRADSIVKNMLLHSRAGTGERREINLNATAQESLNLAYHGARAENPSFNVRLSTAFDPNAGSIEAYPQELVRVLLNLISNAFHAVHQRQRDGGEPSFEPEVTVSTRALPHGVEIRVRDNGTGIPDDVRAKMFDPFFTTKPPGEGTGLGLSLSHDIVVKQHGGRIDVDTRVGEFTEFVITLPRGASAGQADQRSAP